MADILTLFYDVYSLNSNHSLPLTHHIDVFIGILNDVDNSFLRSRVHQTAVCQELPLL